jgi:hypothetical protein
MIIAPCLRKHNFVKTLLPVSSDEGYTSFGRRFYDRPTTKKLASKTTDYEQNYDNPSFVTLSSASKNLQAISGNPVRRGRLSKVYLHGSESFFQSPLATLIRRSTVLSLQLVSPEKIVHQIDTRSDKS